MRLTKLTNKGMNGTPIYVGSRGNIANVGDNQATSMVHHKLGQLEDIEDELGIDLITLFKALKNGFYGKQPWSDGKIKHYTSKTHDFGFDAKRLLTYSTGYEIDDEYGIKDYGKTWALTKGELENGK